jgi:hypothetical protein
MHGLRSSRFWGVKGDSTSQEAPIANQRSGLLWRGLTSIS